MPAIDPAVGHLLAVALAAIFAWSAVLKLTDVELFEGAVARYRLLPHLLERSFARVLPLCECTGAVGLLFASTRSVAAIGLVGLLGLFSGAIAINLLRGRTHIDCGCFGPALRQELSVWLLVRNGVLMIFAALVVAPATARPIEWIDDVTIVLGATTLVTLYASANYALGSLRRLRTLEALG